MSLNRFNKYFYIDSMDIDYIEEKLSILLRYTQDQSFLGITTNPRIVQKAGITSVSQYFEKMRNLIERLLDLNLNTYITIWIQPFNLSWSSDKIVKFIKDHIDLLPQNSNRFLIGCKLGPDRSKILEISDEMYNNGFNLTKFAGFNITGLTTSTELLAYGLSGYNINYVSFLTGRLEECGIDPYTQLTYAAIFRTYNIISGSLRTFEQLRNSIGFGCIPTIGNSILDQLNSPENIQNFINAMNTEEFILNSNRPSKVNIEPYLDISEKFFEQMNTIGQQIENG